MHRVIDIDNINDCFNVTPIKYVDELYISLNTKYAMNGTANITKYLIDFENIFDVVILKLSLLPFCFGFKTKFKRKNKIIKNDTK